MNREQAYEEDIGIQELTNEEVDCISGAASIKEVAVKVGSSFGLAGAIGAATWGSTWGVMAVGAAVGAAPLAVVAMGGLVAYGAYTAVTYLRNN